MRDTLSLTVSVSILLGCLFATPAQSGTSSLSAEQVQIDTLQQRVSSLEAFIQQLINRRLIITSPGGGSFADCSPGAIPPTIRWQPGVYDKFKVFVGWTAELSVKERASSGRKLLTGTSWTVPREKWSKLCGRSDPDLFLMVSGIDTDVPKGHPERLIVSESIRITTSGAGAGQSALIPTAVVPAVVSADVTTTDPGGAPQELAHDMVVITLENDPPPGGLTSASDVFIKSCHQFCIFDGAAVTSSTALAMFYVPAATSTTITVTGVTLADKRTLAAVGDTWQCYVSFSGEDMSGHPITSEWAEFAIDFVDG